MKQSQAALFRIHSVTPRVPYDCRRPEYFIEQLYAVLTLIDRGVLCASTRGSMRGEIGQTQFLPKNILVYGTGNLDVAANALSSTANFLKSHGWHAGAGYQSGEANFAAIQAWNAASVYQRAIAYSCRGPRAGRPPSNAAQRISLPWFSYRGDEMSNSHRPGRNNGSRYCREH